MYRRVGSVALENIRRMQMAEYVDTISRQAAINLAEGGCHPANLAEEIRKLPSEQPPTTDTISRQEAIDAMCRLHKEDILDYGADIPEGFNIDCRDRAVYELKQLQSVQPERPTGRWETAMLDHEAFGVRPKVLYCSECRQCIAYPTRYCPNCGCRMMEVEHYEV